MNDISDLMFKFKDAVRHSWNTYFANSDASMSSEMQEAFNSVEIGLFQAIVLAPLGIFDKAKEYRKHPLPFIIVKPTEELLEMPLQFGEVDVSGNTVWAMPTSVKVQPDMAFEFYDFFDWRPYGYIDLPYTRARLRVLPGQEDPQGKVVLIEQHVCRFLFTLSK